MAITKTYKASGMSAPGAPDFFHRIEMAVGGDNYVTGGLALDPAADVSELTGNTVVAVMCMGGGGYHAEYDYTNKKLLVYYCDYDAGADGALIQYPDATALTATFVLLVVAK